MKERDLLFRDVAVPGNRGPTISGFDHMCRIAGAEKGSYEYRTCSDERPPLPGHAIVWHDGKRWLYRVRLDEREAFVLWLCRVFAPATVAGAWPKYVTYRGDKA